MTKTMRRLIGSGAAVAAVTGLTIGVVPQAQAAADFNYTAPAHATNVKTLVSKKLDGGGTLQIRRGNYNGRTYFWGRIDAPGKTYNSGYDLQFFHTGGQNFAKCGGQTIKDIDKTTYTAAIRVEGCKYMAAVIKRSSLYRAGSVEYTT